MALPLYGVGAKRIDVACGIKNSIFKHIFGLGAGVLPVLIDVKGLIFMQKTNRPVYLDITVLGRQQPIPALVSILHRISGVLLFVSLPLLLYLFAGTLGNEQEYASYRTLVGHPIVKLGLLVLLWAYLHHALAGVRFLFLDAHKGLELQTARLTAKIVFALALVLTAILGVVLW